MTYRKMVRRLSDILQKPTVTPKETADYFNPHLITHLTKTGAVKVSNPAEKVLIDAAKEGTDISKLTRLFDAYGYPVTSDAKLQKTNQAHNGLKTHMQEILDGILPALLNQERTSLHQKVIEAMSPYYSKIVAKSTAEDVALTVVKAIIASYAQRLHDDGASTEIMHAVTTLSSEVTLHGLPAHSAQPEQIDRNLYYNMAIRMQDALDTAKTAGINNKKDLGNLISKIENTTMILSPDMDSRCKMDDATILMKSSFKDRVEDFIREATEMLRVKPEKPKKFTDSESDTYTTQMKAYQEIAGVLQDLSSIREELSPTPNPSPKSRVVAMANDMLDALEQAAKTKITIEGNEALIEKVNGIIAPKPTQGSSTELKEEKIDRFKSAQECSTELTNEEKLYLKETVTDFLKGVHASYENKVRKPTDKSDQGQYEKQLADYNSQTKAYNNIAKLTMKLVSIQEELFPTADEKKSPTPGP